MHRRTRVDRFREGLFTLRDEFFDYMWKHDISFDLPAYRLMRAFLNGAIRAAGDITPTMFVVVMFAVRRHAPAPALSAAIGEIEDPSIREHFRQTRSNFVELLPVFLGPIGRVLGLAVKLDRLVFGSEDSVARPLFAGHGSRLVFRR